MDAYVTFKLLIENKVPSSLTSPYTWLSRWERGGVISNTNLLYREYERFVPLRPARQSEA